MKRTQIATVVAIVGVLTSIGMAGITPHYSVIGTPGMPGYLTWTVGFSTDSGRVTTLELNFVADEVNQVNPSGLPTIFQDNNDQFGSTPVEQDSQFLYLRSDLLEVSEERSVESSTTLGSIFGFQGGYDSPLAFQSGDVAQLVLPVDQQAVIDGLFTVSQSSGDPGELQSVGALTPQGGDTDFDGDVDTDDASVLLANWQQSGGWEDGDFDGNGVVDLDDASILLANWPDTAAGETTSLSGFESLASASVVPEPATMALLGIGAVALIRRRRR
ncbi:MAG: PEP-CTERM sorting domain-containing protein [Phycisphaerae bacterium]